MSPVAVVTDSTADLGELAAAANVAVVPLTVSFGSETYRDGIDLTREAFYQKLETSRTHPTTAQPPPSAFAATYRRLLGAGASHIVSLHISAKLSGTCSSATSAAQEVDAQKITVVDTRNVSLALGLLVLQAAEQARAGMSAGEVVAKAKAAALEVELYAAIPTLTYLARGGRIGQLQSVLGNVLKIVPIVTLRDGEVAEYSKVRTYERALDRIVEIATGKIQSRGTARVAVLHAIAPVLAAQVAARLEQAVAPVQLITNSVGPTVGTHAGPGAVGVCFLQ